MHKLFEVFCKNKDLCICRNGGNYSIKSLSQFMALKLKLKWTTLKQN